MTVGERIRKRRTELELSQSDLAKRAGYSDKSAISRFENSGDEISLKQIHRVADALKVTTSYLMGWSKEEEEIIDHISARVGAIGAKDEEQMIEAMKRDTNFWNHILTLFGMTLSYKNECYAFIDFKKEQEKQQSGESSAESKGA